MRGTKEIIHLPRGHSFRLLCWNQTLSQVDTVTSPDTSQRIPGEGNHWHYHLEMELTLFTEGHGTRCVGDHVARFGPGDLVLLGERLPHYWHTPGSSAGLSIQWHFPHSHPLWAFPESQPLERLFANAARGIRFSGPTAAEVTPLLQQLPLSHAASQLARFLLALARLAEAPPSDATLLSARAFDLPSNDLHQAAIARAMRHLIAHFREPVPLEDLLVLTDMSRATFARLFKTHSGRTFSDFLNQLRLEAACHELRHTSRSVVDIAYASGFSQISFFNRLFQRVLRCTPSAYRTQNQTRGVCPPAPLSPVSSPSLSSAACPPPKPRC